MEIGRKFQLREVIGTNVLANEVVRQFFNLMGIGKTRSTDKVCFKPRGKFLTK